MPTTEAFANRLRKARENKSLSRRALAELIQAGYSALSNYESGSREPNFATTEKLAAALGVSAGWLAFDEGDAHN